MKAIPTNEKHGESFHPLHSLWVGFCLRARKRGDQLPTEVTHWPTLKAANPYPREYIDGKAGVKIGLVDPSKGYTADNIGWILRPKRRET